MGAEMRAAFPAGLKRFSFPGLPETTLTRARQGSACSAFYRSALVLLALRVGGAPRERAQRLVDRLQDLVDRLWPPEEIPPTKQLSRQEQAVDGAENVAQLDYHDDVPGASARWADLLRERQAITRTLLLRLSCPEDA
jgi:hypothetical protein